MKHWEPLAETLFSALAERNGRQNGREEGQRGSRRPDDPPGDRAIYSPSAFRIANSMETATAQAV
jgi:hypothetical protein